MAAPAAPSRPRLQGPVPGTAAALNTWSTSGGAPGNLMFFGFGFTCAPFLLPSTPPALLDLSPLAVFAALSDPNGDASLVLNIPPIASGLSLMTQCAELLGTTCRVSNLVDHAFP